MSPLHKNLSRRIIGKEQWGLDRTLWSSKTS